MKESDLGKCFYKTVIDMIAYKQFKRNFIIFHVPNEQMTTYRYTKHLMAQGMMPGVCDYIILYEGGWATIELKRNKKCKLTENQKIFITKCSELGGKHLTTYDLWEAIEFLKNL